MNRRAGKCKISLDYIVEAKDAGDCALILQTAVDELLRKPVAHEIGPAENCVLWLSFAAGAGFLKFI